MRNYVIINGVNSLTIQGLAIKTLPPITKPIQRNLREEIDGRDGDIVTTLGYGAYDKTIEIGLFGTFDIDEVIAYFNQKGTITFSNEADKVYYFEALDQVDYAELLKFRTANVVLHCQPFKYPLNETPLVEEYEYVTGTGTDITLNNTEETEFNEIELQGNTSQVQTIGKNLVPFTNQDFTLKNVRYYVQDGSLYLNGTSTGETSSISQEFKDNFTFTLPAGTYYASCGSSGRSYYLYNKTTNTPIFSNPNFVSGGTTRTFTLTEETTLYIGFYVYQNTFNNVNNEIMISTSSGSYEPYTYGATPNPNYPQDIHVVSGNNVVEITGRNLFNNKFDEYTRPLDYLIHPIGLEQGQTYTLKATLTGTKISGIVVGIVPIGEKYSDFSTRMFIAINSGGNTEAKRTITIDETWTSPKLIVYCPASSLQATFESIFENYEIQLEKGSTLGNFEPYNGETYPLSLGSLEMASIPNTTYKDLFVKENGTWYKRANVSKVVLDGSESGWFFEGQRYRINNIIQAKPFSTFDYNNPLAYSNYFKWGNGVGSAFVEGAFWYVASGLDLSLQKDQNPNATTLADFKTWLGTHNTIVYYVLATTTDIEITNETLIEQLEAIKNAISYKGQTNITQTNNDMPFVLDLSALKENSDHLVIDNIGNIYSKPTLDLEGTGIVDIYLNDTQMFEVDLTEKNEIVIDTEKMEAYNPTDNTLANRQVTGDYSKFKLDSGENDLRFSGDLTKATITKYIRWL